MLVVGPPTAVRFSTVSFHSTTRRKFHSGSFYIPWNKFRRLKDSSCSRRISLIKHRIRASAEEQSDSASGPVERIAKPLQYHQFEDVSDSEAIEGEEARLTPAETTRTIIEVNSKATLMFSGFINEEVHENIFWPELPYVNDEYGNIYFQVKNEEDILQSLATDDNLVQVIIGLDTTEMLSEMELLDRSEIDFGVEEIENEDSDVDDEGDSDGDDEDNSDGDDEKGWVSILDDEEDQEGFDETLGDWAKLETMRSSHPMYFANKLSEFVSDDPLDYMEQPPAGLAIQGLLRPAFIEEHSVIEKHISNRQSSNADKDHVEKTMEDKVEDCGAINGHRDEPESSQDSSLLAEESEKNQNVGNGTLFYKLEMIKIQLISPHGQQTVVEIEDFGQARSDTIAHSAAKIMSRLKAGGEKATQALKGLCWRCKGIQVEEATLIGIDALGFDLRVCSGTQVQTLRFGFHKRASSEYSAERQLNDILFPTTNQKPQKSKEAQQTEL